MRTAMLVSLLATAPLGAQGPQDGAAPLVPPGSMIPSAAPVPAPVPGPLAGPWVVPQAYQTRMGDWANMFPHGWANLRYQQVFLGSELPQAGVWRAMGLRLGNTVFGRQGGRVRLSILLGRTTFTHNSMTSVFANNANSGPQTMVANAVYYNIPSLVGANNNPAQWDVVFPFTTPYPYTPAAGQNLLVEVVNTSDTGHVYSYFDAVSTTVTPTTARLYAYSATAVSGSGPHNNGMIMAFFDSAQSQADYGLFGQGCPGSGGSAGIIVPAMARSMMGIAQNIYGHSFADQRYQQIFLGSEMGPPRLLTGHAFRGDDAYPPSGGTITIEVLMGTTTRLPTGITTSFAANATGTQTLVLPKTGVNTPSLAANVNPREFLIRIPWTTPWLWPAIPGDNLLFENRNHDTTTMANQYFDAHGGVPTARIWASPVTAVTANSTDYSTDYGLVIQFLHGGAASDSPLLGNTGRPVLGKTMSIHLFDGKPSSAALLLLGVSNAQWGPFTLPLDLVALGAPSCNLLVSVDLFAYTGITNTQGTTSATLMIPNAPVLDGIVWFNQWMVFDSAANRLGLAFSNGGRAKVGAQ